METIDISDSGLDEPVTYTCRDSMIFDVENELVHMYGAASVVYGELTLNADYIVLNQADNTVSAEYLQDSLGRKTGIPEFKEGELGFKSQKMKYNFKTKKGIIYDVSTKQSDMYVLGSKAKFTAGDKDSLHQHDDYVYSENAIFTTCNHAEPHFGLRSRKQKIVPGKTVVVGPTNLELGGVPTPIWLPFGFFPLKETKSTGLIFPRGYEFSEQWGYGLSGIGWYFPINDNLDLTLTSDIYVRGTWGLNASASYKKRYKYSGNATVTFWNRFQEQPDASKFFERSFGINWRHTQDSKAHPSMKFGGNIRFETDNNQRRNFNNAEAVLTNEYSSNLNFSKSFPGRPFSLTASFSHSQNTNNRDVIISFPTFNFQTQELYPFKRKERVGKEKWFEQVRLRYVLDARNRFTAKDTTLFRQQTLDDAQFGARHSVDINTSFNLLKYINVTPNISYDENWYWQTENRTFNDDLIITMDTTINTLDSTNLITSDTTFGFVSQETDFGFRPYRRFSTSVSANTQIFGTKLFKKGWLRGIRHVIKPNVDFRFSPDETDPDRNYFQTVSSDSRPEFDDPQLFNIFENAIFDRPNSGGRQLSIGYGFSNQLEAKVFSKRDSTTKNIKLFRTLTVRGDYNFARDSLQWSDVTFSGTADLIKGISTLNISGRLTPYTLNEFNENILIWDDRKRLLNLTTLTATISNRLSIRSIRQLFSKGDQKPGQSNSGRNATNGRDDAPEKEKITEASFASVFGNMSLSHNIVFNLSELQSGRDTFSIRTNSLSLRGEIPLTEKWKLTVGNIGYDFNAQSITYPDLTFYRDLHCWETGITWQPRRGTYLFFLRVKPGPLGFLDLPYQKNNADAFGGF